MYAFRKLRDKLIIEDSGLSHLYKVNTYKPPPPKSPPKVVLESDREKHIRIEMAHRKLSAKPTLYEKIAREFTPGEIKHIRRREYYNRRVRPDFAPPKLEQEIPEIIKRLDNMDEPLTPDTREREEKRLDYLVNLREKNKKLKENLPEFKH